MTDRKMQYLPCPRNKSQEINTTFETNTSEKDVISTTRISKMVNSTDVEMDDVSSDGVSSRIAGSKDIVPNDTESASWNELISTLREN